MAGSLSDWKCEPPNNLAEDVRTISPMKIMFTSKPFIQSPSRDSCLVQDLITWSLYSSGGNMRNNDQTGHLIPREEPGYEATS